MAGVTAASCQLTADAGTFALEKGGNAIDALIAAQLMACVCEPVMTGFNGAGIISIKMNDKVEIIDCFGSFPYKAGKKIPPKREVRLQLGPELLIFHVGSGSIGLANIPTALEELHKKYGTLPLSLLAEPAIKAARDGFACHKMLENSIKFLWPILALDKNLVAIFSHNGDETNLKKTGDIITIPNLDKTIEKFATEGAKYFTEGDGAKYFIKTYEEDLRALLGTSDLSEYALITSETLADYSTKWKEPIKTNYRGAEVYLPPAPSQSGLQTEFSLKYLSNCTVPPYFSKEYIELYCSANIATEKFKNSEGYTDLLGTKDAPGKVGSTTHISIVDKDGNLAAFTSSLGETCGIIVPETGVILNNLLGEEDVAPSDFKFTYMDRLLTMCCPIIIHRKNQDDSSIWYAVGSPGGSRIRTAILQSVIGLIDANLTLKEVSDHPRLHFENNILRLEDGNCIASDELQAIENKLQISSVKFSELNFYFGGIHLVSYENSSGTLKFSGAADPRRGGKVKFNESN